MRERIRFLRQDTAGAVLLAALVLIVLLLPVAVGAGRADHFVRIALGLTVVASVALLSQARWAIWAMLAVAAAHEATHLPEPALISRVQSQALLALQFGFVAFLVLRHLVSVKQVTTDTVMSAISGFLLLAMFWATLYAITEALAPGSYLMHDQPAGAHPTGHIVFLYFSLVTITTLGYGDIVPGSPAAGMLASLEAVVGQLYVAILVARIVALRVSEPRT
jgi:hypothetical protein